MVNKLAQAPRDILGRPVPGGNQLFFDRFSLAHVAVGVTAELAAIPAPYAIGAATAFEFVENDIKKVYGRFWPADQPDAWQNSAGDILSFAIGYYGARAMKTDGLGRCVLVGLAAAAGALWTSELLKHGWNNK